MWYRTNTGERLINLENGNIIMLNGKQISFNIPHEKTDTFDTEKEAQETFEKLGSRLLNDPFKEYPVLKFRECKGVIETAARKELKIYPLGSRVSRVVEEIRDLILDRECFRQDIPVILFEVAKALGREMKN